MAKLRERRESLRSVGQAPQTIKGYSSDIRVFQRWCDLVGRDSIPCSAETLAFYVVWLLTDGERRIATSERHLAAVVDLHRRTRNPVPVTGDAREVINAIRRERREQSRGKAALDGTDLIRVAESCGTSNLDVRDQSLITLGFATSLRRSELSRLDLSDVVFEGPGLVVLVRWSKRDQLGKGRLIPVWSGTRASTDPVGVLRTWLDRRGPEPGRLFLRIQTGDKITRRGMTGDAVSDTVKRAVARAGLNPELYGAHSLRAGAITASAELGRSDQELMLLSGHANAKQLKIYVRRARLFVGRNPLDGVL